MKTIFGLNKDSVQLNKLLQDLLDKNQDFIITKVSQHTWTHLADIYTNQLHYKLGTIWHTPHTAKEQGTISVITAGDADAQYAEEAAIVLEAYGYTVNRIYDVGVNDMPKLLNKMPEINDADVIISVQGLEGALPVVVAGLTELPIISVPVSTGYGLSADGKAALLTSLTSCTTGISTINIDNGFGAAEAARRILNNKY